MSQMHPIERSVNPKQLLSLLTPQSDPIQASISSSIERPKSPNQFFSNLSAQSSSSQLSKIVRPAEISGSLNQFFQLSAQSNSSELSTISQVRPLERSGNLNQLLSHLLTPTEHFELSTISQVRPTERSGNLNQFRSDLLAQIKSSDASTTSHIRPAERSKNLNQWISNLSAHSEKIDTSTMSHIRSAQRSINLNELVSQLLAQSKSFDASGPRSPKTMNYIEQNVLAKYPEYSNALIEGGEKTDLYDFSLLSADNKQKLPRDSVAPKFGGNHPDLDKTQLEPSRLQDVLTKKASFLGSFTSIPEIQARNKVLNQCGLPDEEYLVIFTSHYKDAMMLVGESYPFFRGRYYLTIMKERDDYIREFASYKESKVIIAPETWLDLRIRGSQLSQYFRRKSKHTPKGLFSYPADVNGTQYSMHWVSEAHRNSWHVLLDATALIVGEDRLNLTLHRPDFVLCSPDNTRARPSDITCLLIRKRSFYTGVLV